MFSFLILNKFLFGARWKADHFHLNKYHLNNWIEYIWSTIITFHRHFGNVLRCVWPLDWYEGDYGGGFWNWMVFWEKTTCWDKGSDRSRGFSSHLSRAAPLVVDQGGFNPFLPILTFFGRLVQTSASHYLFVPACRSALMNMSFPIFHIHISSTSSQEKQQTQCEHLEFMMFILALWDGGIGTERLCQWTQWNEVRKDQICYS